MLSPHEFTTLMILRDAPDQVEPDRAELHTLVELRLVVLESFASGQQRPHITPDGYALLKAVCRAR